MSDQSPPKRRNATATRAAILDSARQAFAKFGYDGAGVREIAAGAGVTAMMVNRYFGSKENLFAEVIADVMSRPTILTRETLSSTNISEEIAAKLVAITAPQAPPLEGFQIMLRSAASDRAASIGREQIDNHSQRILSAALPGEFASQRSAIILALVAGLQLMRQMIALPALADADPNVLTQVLTPLVKQLVENSASGTKSV